MKINLGGVDSKQGGGDNVTEAHDGPALNYEDKETRWQYVKKLLQGKCVPGSAQEQALLRVF